MTMSMSPQPNLCLITCTRTVKIPPSLIFSVIRFADEILVPGLVCLRKYRSFALDVVLEDLYPALESGREFLVQMGNDEVEMLLLLDHFSPLDRWKILIAWCKSQLSSDISLDRLADYPDEISDDVACELIESLLPAVDLFKMETEDLKYVGCYGIWLPEVVQDLLLFRTRGTTASGVNEWKPEQRRCITNQEVKDILAAVKCLLPLEAIGVLPELLFHAKPAGFSNDKFHVMWHWTSDDEFIPCETAFLFIMTPTSTIRLLPYIDKDCAIFGDSEAGATFGLRDLVVNKTKVTGSLGLYELFGSFGEDETCAFVRSLLQPEGAVAVGEIEDYKVFQLL
ncbi:hypothetical protein HDU81_009027 [Chytriomyces hyalinus]|nr:hypothetical protein HDU81_009027 [Chytriomyces hyalinus]